MRILVACEYSGTVRDAFIAVGHEAMSCDFLETEKPGPHYVGDVRDVLYNGWDMLIAHPPCTRLTNAASRWFIEPPPGKTLEQMFSELDEAVEFYQLLRNAPIQLKAIENPIMHCHARERLGYIKRHFCQPYWFGDPAFKATGFELQGLPALVPTNLLQHPEKGTEEHRKWSWVHRAAPGPERWKIRSRTFPGIAVAMALQWGQGQYQVDQLDLFA